MAEVMAAQAVQNSTAINVHVFRNGDPYFPPKKCVINPRRVNFDSFLNEVTRLVRLSGGAARQLYTPTHGHRIKEVSQLVNNSYYVAGGLERFKKDQYTAGGVRMLRPRQRQTKQIKPVAHARIQVSAKIRKATEGPKIIHVFRNRDDKSPSVKLLLDKRHRGNMELVYDYVNQKVNLISGQAVRRLYHLNGAQVLDESEIETGGQYVAAAREKFAKVGYGNTELSSPRGKIGFIFGRVPSGTTYGLKPVVQLPKVKTATKISPRVPQAKKHPIKPTPKPPAKRPPIQRRKIAEKAAPPKKEEESVFPMKPTMVKRSREKDEKSPLDYSDDPNSVFKAKEKRDEERGASEVQDTNDTVTELPIDQVAAEEVEEDENLKEDFQPDEGDDKVVDKAPPSPPKSPEVEEDVPEEVPEAEEEQETLMINQNNNHLENNHHESLQENNNAPPPVIEEEIKPSSPPATPSPKAESTVPTPPQNRPESRESPAFMTDKVKSPEPESSEEDKWLEPEQNSPEPEQQESTKSPSPDLALPKSPSPMASDSPSPKSSSPKPQTPQQEKSPSPKPQTPQQEKSPSPPLESIKSPSLPKESPSPQKSNSESPSPKNSVSDEKLPSERGSASSSQRSMSAPAGNSQDTFGEIANSNSNDENEPIAELPENQGLSESSDNQVSDSNDTNKSPSPENKIRTPSPPKSPRKTPSRSRSRTPPPIQSPAPKEQIGNGHAHPEEVNA